MHASAPYLQLIPRRQHAAIPKVKDSSAIGRRRRRPCSVDDDVYYVRTTVQMEGWFGQCSGVRVAATALPVAV